MIRPRHIARGVELFPARTPTLPPATHMNSYALGGRDLLLVEPAPADEDERRAWIEWVRAMPLRGRKPIAILVTHHHIDHAGASSFFARELGLPVWAHRETASRLPGDVTVSRYLEEGEEIVLEGPAPQSFRVLHTPGHAPGHLCLYEAEQRALVAGDMVASVGTILVAPGDGDMAEYLAQLGRLAALDASVALPAHGDPIDKPTELFEHYVAHRLGREAKVRAALERSGSEGSTLESLLPSAYADTPLALWPLARLSLEAHLIKLEREGHAIRRDARWLAIPRG